MRPAAKAGIVIAGYVAAVAVASLVLRVYIATTSGADRQTYGGMYAFGPVPCDAGNSRSRAVAIVGHADAAQNSGRATARPVLSPRRAFRADAIRAALPRVRGCDRGGRVRVRRREMVGVQSLGWWARGPNANLGGVSIGDRESGIGNRESA